MHIHLCTARFQVGVDTPTDVTSPGLVRLSTRIVIRLRNYITGMGGRLSGDEGEGREGKVEKVEERGR